MNVRKKEEYMSGLLKSNYPDSRIPKKRTYPSKYGMITCLPIEIQTAQTEKEPTPHLEGGCPRGVMVKAMHYGIVVREFVLQSRYYVHFRANTLGKGMNPLILPPAMGK